MAKKQWLDYPTDGTTGGRVSDSPTIKKLDNPLPVRALHGIIFGKKICGIKMKILLVVLFIKKSFKIN